MRKLRLNRPLVMFVVVAPEFAKLAGAAIPTERANDDKYIWPTLTGKAGKPYEEFFYDKGNSLSAVRSGKWKLHPNKRTPTQLHDPDNDIGLEQDPRRTLMQSVAGFNWLETTPDSPPQPPMRLAVFWRRWRSRKKTTKLTTPILSLNLLQRPG